MPDCSVYIGPSVISLGLFFEDTSKQPVFCTYPYSFLTHYHSDNKKKAFLDELLTAFLADYSLNLPQVNCLYTSFDFNFLNRTFKDAASMYDLFHHDINSYFCASGVVMSHGNILYASSYLRSNQAVLAENEKLNTVSNFELYPFTFGTDEFSRGIYDDNIIYLASLLGGAVDQGAIPYESGHDITFTGDRYTYYNNDKESVYLLLLELLSNPGIYRVKVDTDNVVTHIKNMERKKHKFSTSTKEKVFSVGTFVKLESAAECYVETHIGTKQVFQLQQNQLLTIPLPIGEKAKITVKMAGVNTFESQVIGGNLGIVFYNYQKKKELFVGLAQSYAKEVRNIIREGLLEL